MFITFLWLWLMAPLIIIGLIVFAAVKISSLNRKNRQYRDLIEMLRQQGRISEEEYYRAVGNGYRPGNAYGYPGQYYQHGYDTRHGAEQSSRQQGAAVSQPHWRSEEPGYGWQQNGQPAGVSPQREREQQSAPQRTVAFEPIDKRTAFEMEMEAASRRQPSPFADTIEPKPEGPSQSQLGEMPSGPPSGQPPAPSPRPGALWPLQEPGLKQMYQPRSRKPLSVNPANVILVLGVLFITVAGLIFSTTTWQVLPNFARIAIVFSESILFFGVSVLAQKKLQLKNTALAFYVLGSIFLPIGVLAVGYFQLFGWWFSLWGPGRYVLGFTGSLLFMAASVLGARLHKIRQFAWAALPCLALCLAFGVMALRSQADTLALVMAVYFAGFVLAVRPLRKKAIGGELAGLLSVQELELFALLQLSAGAVWILYLAETGFLGCLAALFCAAAFLSPQFEELPHVKNGVGIYPFTAFLLASLYFFNGEFGELAMVLMEGACVLIILENMKLLKDEVRIGAAICGGVLMIASAASYIITFPVWTLQMLLSVTVLTAASTYTVLTGQKEGREVRPLLYAQPFFVVILAYGIYDLYFYYSSHGELILAAVAMIAFFLYRFVPLQAGQRLRTGLSDMVFFLTSLFTCLVVYETASEFLSMGMAIAILAVCVKDRRPAGFLMPLLVALELELLFELLGNPVHWFAERALSYGVLTVLAAATVVLRKMDYARRLQLPFAIAVVLGWWCYSENYSSLWVLYWNWQTVFTWIFTAYWFYCLLAPGYGENRLKAAFEGGTARTAMGSDSGPGATGSAGGTDGGPGTATSGMNPTFAGNPWDRPYTVLQLSIIHKWRETIFLMFGIGFAAAGWYTMRSLTPMSDAGWFLAGPALALGLIMGSGWLQKVKEDEFLRKWTAGFAVAGFQILALLMILAFDGGFIGNPLGYALLGITVCFVAAVPLHMKKITGYMIVPVLVLMGYLWWLLEERILLGMSLEGTAVMSMVMLLLFGGAGRFLYRTVFETDGKLKIHVDWLTVVSVIPVLSLFPRGMELWGWLQLAGYALLFYERGWKHPRADSIALTAACAALGGAVISQAYRVPADVRTLVILGTVLAVLLAVHVMIWKEKKVTEPILFGYSVLAIAVMMGEAMLFGYNAHAFVLGVGGMVMLFLGWKGKRKSWFVLAAVTLVVVGVYLSRRFWLSVAWWIYLLVAGIILIAAGAANEKGKQKGTSLKGRLDDFWDDWKW